MIGLTDCSHPAVEEMVKVYTFLGEVEEPSNQLNDIEGAFQYLQELLVSWRELLLSWRELLMSWRELLVSWRELLVSWRELLVSWRDLLVSWRDLYIFMRTSRISCLCLQTQKAQLGQRSYLVGILMSRLSSADHRVIVTSQSAAKQLHEAKQRITTKITSAKELCALYQVLDTITMPILETWRLRNQLTRLRC